MSLINTALADWASQNARWLELDPVLAVHHEKAVSAATEVGHDASGRLSALFNLLEYLWQTTIGTRRTMNEAALGMIVSGACTRYAMAAGCADTAQVPAIHRELAQFARTRLRGEGALHALKVSPQEGEFLAIVCVAAIGLVQRHGEGCRDHNM